MEFKSFSFPGEGPQGNTAKILLGLNNVPAVSFSHSMSFCTCNQNVPASITAKSSAQHKNRLCPNKADVCKSTAQPRAHFENYINTKK